MKRAARHSMLVRSPVLWLCLLVLAVLGSTLALAEEFDFQAPRSARDAQTPKLMRDLAERILPVYEDKDTDRYLTNLAALQLVAGTYVAADDTRRSLRERRQAGGGARPVEREVLYDIYAQARAIETRDQVPFAQAFNQSFREVVPRLSDRDAHAVTAWFEAPTAGFEQALQASFDRWRGKGSVPFADAVELVWTYLAFEAHRSFRPLVQALDLEEERRRYLSEENVVIRTRQGADIRATVVRPKNVTTPLPALLEFTIETAGNDAKGAAAHGYVGVVAYTRGKNGKGRGRIEPFEHDGEDARAVIAWIVKQPWSDQRVGMYGEGYSGFAAWSAARRAPAALKAIATSSPMAPGIDFPMSGHVFRNEAYRWAQTYTLAPRDVPDDEDDDARWQALNRAWYRSGLPYRELDRRFGKPNRIFRRWLNHPSYDRYWQKMIPFREQFAGVHIPVLTTAGYYGGDAGALYYFLQHQRFDKKADHTLLVGPYDNDAPDNGLPRTGNDAVFDTVAGVDLRELRFQWFDSIFRNGARPPLLKDRVNYQVMGANEWRHAPSIPGMANGALRFYFAGGETPERHRLLAEKSREPIRQTVKLGEHADADVPPPSTVALKTLPDGHALVFASEPLQQPVEAGGLLSGKLDFTPNKQDVDLNIALYEQLPNGTYLKLFEPWEIRASYLKDRVNRQLLGAGLRQQLAFTSERLFSRRLQAGSRVVLVLGVNRRPDREINYGAGNDVSVESRADAGAPLQIRWFGSSFIELPVRK